MASEEEVLGKAYDSRLMKRLITYLRPYKWQVGIALVFSFLLEYLQTYFMQWAGQMTMFDLRAQIFRHLQRMHIGFYDKNPVGRLVTRLTTDVDAVNEMFTSRVFA